MFGMTSLPYVKDYAKEIDNRLPFSHMGDLTKSEKYIEAEKVLKANPNITHAVGYSMGGSVALELQKYIRNYKLGPIQLQWLIFQMQYLQSTKPTKKDIEI